MLHGHNRYGYWQDVIDTSQPAGGWGWFDFAGWLWKTERDKHDESRRNCDEKELL